MPNFKKLAKGYESLAVKTLTEFVRKGSVYDPTTIEEGAPYGAGVKSALDYVAKLGKEYGFKVDTCDGRVTELSYGEEGTLVGVYAHADVVPVSGKWKFPPFSAKVVGEGKEAMMYGRGTSDDKGPLIAALMAMKLLKDNGLIKGYRVRLAAGGDEERGSSCLEYYFKHLKKEDCDYGFTPDAEFPLIYAEKGIAHFDLVYKGELGPIVNIDGGVVRNAVCDRINLTLPTDRKFISFFKEAKIEGDIADFGEVMMVTIKGKSAHASTPEIGENAALKAFRLIGDFYHVDILSKLSKVLSESDGSSFGGKQTSKELGDSTYSYGIVKYDGKKLVVTVDYRYGENADANEGVEAMKKETGLEVENLAMSKPLVNPVTSPLVKTLMKSYKRMTWKLFDKPMAIGGGTYAKEAKNTVAFGSAFKNHPGDIHQENEYIYLDDLFAQIAIYADAIYSLGQLKK